MKKMLVIDSSLSVRESLRIIFQDAFHVETTDPWQDILSLLTAETFDLIVMGIGSRVGQEIDLLREIAAFNPKIPLIALVEREQKEELEGIALPYITDLVVKPFNVFELKEKVQKLQKKNTLSPYVRSPLKMRHVFQQQKIYFPSTVRYKLSDITVKTKNASLIPVLLQGERGTGREVAAKWLHFRGPSLGKAFVRLDASHLMGEGFTNSFLIKEKGSFHPRNLGTLYLEEIGNVRPEIQERLMEMLEEGSLSTPEGREIAVNFRVVVSTSQDLRKLVYRNVLKEELFYKLNVISIHLPPLRERREEIPEIAQQILETSVQQYALKTKGFTPDALEVLKNYYWPGNVRELMSVLVRSLVFSSKEMLSAKELQFGMEEKTAAPEIEEERPAERKPFIEGVKSDRQPKIQKEDHFPEKVETVFKELVNELAHEIKNPLVAIKTFTQLLSERFDDRDFRDQFYKVAGENVDRIDHLVEKILSSARFSRPALRQVNLHNIIDKSLADNKDFISKKRIVFKKEFKENLPLILTDEEQLHYVFSNILSTIYYLVPEESGVSLSTGTVSIDAKEKSRFPLDRSPNGYAVKLSISYPGDPGGKKDGSHYGIELFLAQQIVERNLGLMEVTPFPGETTVIIKLPVAVGSKS
ncbi:MAG: sigma 54-interacting transcriptional regulator [Deltaproteobacteria bacterium]|nr:sigma 54-interacting transcriptional regulator [Deltaproteobacteria bacterium]